MARKTTTILFLFSTTFVLGFAFLAIRQPKSDGFAKIHMLDVGQGDSFLIEAPNGKQLLIDGGRDDKVLIELAKVMPRGDRSIDVVLATHPDADHIGGLPLVIDRYDVGLFLTSQVYTDTNTFQSLFEKLGENNIPSYFVRKGMVLSLDKNIPSSFSILFPDRDTSDWETNSASVVGRLQVGSRSALFTGDSPSSIENYLTIDNPNSIDVDILKLGHHGSKTSSSEEFLKATSPKLALISAGVNNRYGHPAQEVMNLIKSLDIPTISTQDEGTVTFKTNGSKWYVGCQKYCVAVLK